MTHCGHKPGRNSPGRVGQISAMAAETSWEVMLGGSRRTAALSCTASVGDRYDDPRCCHTHVGCVNGGYAMTTLSGFGSLLAIPEEKITDKITRRVLAGQKG